MLITGLAAIFAAVGACVGSFLNVCIYRMPREDLSVASPRTSFCPSCGESIRWFDNVPVLSWILLGARCRHCKGRIPVRYPFVEALTAVLFVLVLVRTSVPDLPLMAWLPTTAFWALLFAALVVVTFIDIDHRIIPDAISVSGAALAPIAAWCLPGVPIDVSLPHWLGRGLAAIDGGAMDAGRGGVPSWMVLGGAALLAGGIAMFLFRQFSPAWDGSRRTWWDTRLAASVGAALGVIGGGLAWVPNWLESPESGRLIAAMLGMGVGSGSLYGVGVLGRLAFRKDAMGLGDVKLMALLGAVLGWKGVLLAIFIACLLGSIIGIALKVSSRSSYIPFGPFLAAGAAILILGADWVAAGIDWYLSLFAASGR